jgi:hypothetical protein
VSWPETTRWRIVGLFDHEGRPRDGLNVELTVDTHAATVIAAIERAAGANGIRLERLLVDDGAVVLRCLVVEAVPRQARTIATLTGLPLRRVQTVLGALRAAGQVRPSPGGAWELTT